MRILLSIALSMMVSSALADTTGFRADVVFAAPTPLSGNAEIVRRMLTPLAGEQVARELAKMGKSVTGQPIDLAQEHFAVYVPQQRPEAGYGLLVFVPPWNEAALPAGWASALDMAGVIFVSAAHSGNDQNVLERRVPLAIAAATNVIAQYRIDPNRVFIGGFSGGSRVALRLALAYPDLFHGAFLDAGGDPIGTAAVPLPPRDLLQQFRRTTGVAFVAGEHDPGALASHAAAGKALRDWCVFNVRAEELHATAHTVADASALSHALRMLDAAREPDLARQATCERDVDAEAGMALDQVAALAAGGKADEARKLLIETDARFGGLAAPRSIALSHTFP